MSLVAGLNLVSNCVLTVAFGAFLIFLFGRENSLVHRMRPFNTMFVKFALSLCASGSLYNVLTLSEPPVSEMVLNLGLAMLFAWSACFHYMKFVKPLKSKKVVVKKKRIKKVS
jgi:hypothetical protein